MVRLNRSADDTRMGGVTFLSENGKDKDWGVDPAKSDLKITLPGMGAIKHFT